MTDTWRRFFGACRWHTLQRGVLVMATALVLVQSVGVFHRVAHGHPALGLETQHASPTPLSRITTFSRLWGEHTSLTECQLFDEACPDLGTSVAFVFEVLKLAPVHTATVGHEHTAPFEFFYPPRGPPAA